MISPLLWQYKSRCQETCCISWNTMISLFRLRKHKIRWYAVFLSGLLEEMRSALSSPVLDSPNSSADITLDTTGDLTVEDVKDFLMWAHFTYLFWSIRVECILGSTQCFASLGLWMKLRITSGTSPKRMGGLLEFSSTEAGRQTAGGEEHLQLKQACRAPVSGALWSVKSRQEICYWMQKGGVSDWRHAPRWAWQSFNVQIRVRH